MVGRKGNAVDILWNAKNARKLGIFSAKIIVAFMEFSAYNESQAVLETITA